MQTEPKKKPCLCGDIHPWKACPYFIESICSEDWKPDAQTQKKVKEKIQRNFRLKGIIETIRKKVKKDEMTSPTKYLFPRDGARELKMRGGFVVSAYTAGEQPGYHL